MVTSLNPNLVIFLLAILILFVGGIAGVGFSYLAGNGKNPQALLATAGSVLNGVVTANEAVGKMFIPAPAESIIDKILKTAQAGVHAAQQLFNSGQISDTERKQKALDTTMNLLKIEGFEPTPELENAVKDLIEAGIFIIKNGYKNPPAVSPPAKTSNTLIAQASLNTASASTNTHPDVPASEPTTTAATHQTA